MDTEYALNSIRAIRRVDLASIGRANKSAFWCEWNHRYEQSRSFHAMLEGYHSHYKWSKLIRPGDTCIDIGAHSGDTTIPMGIFSSFGETRGLVLAIEPNPDVSEALQITLALNPDQARYVHLPVAVTRFDQDEVQIADHGSDQCNGGIIDGSYSAELLANLNGRTNRILRVPGRSLDSIALKDMTPPELDRLTFVKTDCEGYDKEILRGASSLLNEYKPFIFSEWYDYFTESDSQDLFDAVADIGYVALHPYSWEPIGPKEKTSDLLLVHRSRMSRLAWYANS